MSASVQRLLVVGLVLAFVAVALHAQDGRTSASSFASAKPEDVGMSSERLERIGEALEREIAADRMAGAVVAIARRGQLVFYESFGYLDKAAGTPMPKDAIFAIASMTKPIVAAGALMLFEEGRLLIGEPVGTYLPELAVRKVAVGGDPSRIEAAVRQPTIQDLLRHTSGFVDRDAGNSRVHAQSPPTFYQAQQTREEYLAAFAALPLRYQPGTTWEYGPGFNLLGLAMERLSGQSLGAFLSERVFRPLGMVDTHFTIPSNKVARQAKPLPTDPLTGEAQTVRNHTDPDAVPCGSGCLASTARDYLMFAQMLLNGGSLNGNRLLGTRTIEYMTSDHAGPRVDLTQLHNFPSSPTLNDAYGFGLGVAIRRVDGIAGTMGNAGEFLWYGSQGTAFWVDPQQALVIVYMAQTPGGIRSYYRQLIPALVHQAIVD